jgi:hypothetical protein
MRQAVDIPDRDAGRSGVTYIPSKLNEPSFEFHANYVFLFLADAALRTPESQASEQTLMAIAGHVSKRMLEHYSHIRMAAKRTALDGLVPIPEQPVFEEGVHQNVHQVQVGICEASPKSLN